MSESTVHSAMAILNERHNRRTLKEYMQDRWTRVDRDFTAPPLDDWEIKNGVSLGRANHNRKIILARKDSA